MSTTDFSFAKERPSPFLECGIPAKIALAPQFQFFDYRKAAKL
jgi:hypothetical protein